MLIEALKHGGDVQKAAKQFSRPLSDWLDLSTGISPWVYPVSDIPAEVWRTLPYFHYATGQASDIYHPLLSIAGEYYQVYEPLLTPVAGSQDAIRRIPALLAQASVAIPAIAYREHQYAWQMAGHNVKFYESFEQLQQLLESGQAQHAVLVHPNNPTGQCISNDEFECVREACEGYLIVDEAFIDVFPEQSLTPYLQKAKGSSLIILRSVGKFFGLAGLRLGFVLGNNPVIDQLRCDIAPWAVNHPALWVGQQALADKEWQQRQRQRIFHQEQIILERLMESMANQSIITHVVSAGLFITLFGEREYLDELYKQAAEEGILLRVASLEEHQAWIRIGLPGESLARFFSFIEKIT